MREPARYADRTKVPVQQTRTEIEHVLTRYGATSYAYMTESGRAIIAFHAENRHIKITISLPTGDTEPDRKAARQRWRALLLVIKAKLESVASGIETLEQAFYANVVMPDGRTIHEATSGAVGIAYKSGQVRPLLPDYSTKPGP